MEIATYVTLTKEQPRQFPRGALRRNAALTPSLAQPSPDTLNPTKRWEFMAFEDLTKSFEKVLEDEITNNFEL